MISDPAPKMRANIPAWQTVATPSVERATTWDLYIPDRKHKHAGETSTSPAHGESIGHAIERRRASGEVGQPGAVHRYSSLRRGYDDNMCRDKHIGELFYAGAHSKDEEHRRKEVPLISLAH